MNLSHIYREKVSSDEKDFRTVALKIKSQNPSAIGMCLHPGQFGIFAKRLREIGVNTPLFGCNSMQDSSEMLISGGSLHGAWFLSEAVDPEFERRYSKQFGNNNVVSGAAIHYELGKMLAEVNTTDVSGKQLIDKMVGLGIRTGVVGSFKIVQKDELQYFNIDMIVKRIGLTKKAVN